MDEEKKEHKKCYNCGFYSPYYKKGNIQFTKSEVGGCRCKQKTVEKHGSCDRWINKTYRVKQFSKTATKKALCRILDELSEIRQIMEEAQGNDGE